jgi:hypothetical protein
LLRWFESKRWRGAGHELFLIFYNATRRGPTRSSASHDDLILQVESTNLANGPCEEGDRYSILYYGDYGLNKGNAKSKPKQTAVAVKIQREEDVNSHQVISLIIPYYTLPSRCSF